LSSSESGAARPAPDGGGPLLDIRARWKAGQVCLGLAGLMALVALLRPLAPGASPRIKLAVALALGLGLAGAALLSSLKGRGRAEQLALYAFLILALDGLGQMLLPLGWPAWPLLALVLGVLAVAETLPVALGGAALASALGVADAAWASFGPWRPALAAALGYLALILAINRALAGEKRRLGETLAELARIRHGIGQLEDVAVGAGPPRAAGAAQALRQVSEEGRRARRVDRIEELGQTLGRIVSVARAALGAHAVVYFDLDRGREVAPLRAGAGPDALLRDAAPPLRSDPFAFVLERGQPFYATDFKRLLWALPYYRGEVKVGTLLAAPVRTVDVLSGVLVADRLETQAFTGGEPALLAAFAELVGEAILRARDASQREEMEAEFKAIYPLSETLATLADESEVRGLLLRSSQLMVDSEAAAVAMCDEFGSRYTLTEGQGWAAEFVGREVGLQEKTWTAWVLRSAEGPYLLESVAEHRDRMPLLVLDEGGGRGESLLAFPLRARGRTLGALVLAGRRGSFTAAARRVLGILSNQAAATLSLIQDKERQKELAARDGLTGLYNRRAFAELLVQAIAREDRQSGRLSLVLADLDHFKKLNDTYGHRAGDAALRAAAHVLASHLRKGDQAARFGGEEFVVILPGTDEAGAVQLAERVRAAVQKHRPAFEGARLGLTASFGLAVWPRDGQDADALLAAADRALYVAKQGGRNQVVPASRVAAPVSTEGPSRRPDSAPTCPG
jgi:diguanylate cyclase (GGDEF)-like protein